SRGAAPLKKSASVKTGWTPRKRSRLARPRSASIASTRLFIFASAVARFATTLVLPTPPLPLVTAKTGAGARPSPALARSRREGAAATAPDMGGDSSIETLPAKQQTGKNLGPGDLQIAGEILPEREIGHRQRRGDDRIDQGAEVAALVELGGKQAVQADLRKTRHPLAQVGAVGGGVEQQQPAHVRRALKQPGDFLDRAVVARIHPRRVDQHQVAVAQALQRPLQIFPMGRLFVARAENTAVDRQRIAGGKAARVHVDPADAAAAALSLEDRELDQARRLADAGRAEERDPLGTVGDRAIPALAVVARAGALRRFAQARDDLGRHAVLHQQLHDLVLVRQTRREPAEH